MRFDNSKSERVLLKDLTASVPPMKIMAFPRVKGYIMPKMPEMRCHPSLMRTELCSSHLMCPSSTQRDS